MEEKLRTAILEELGRQAAEGALRLGAPDAEGFVPIDGRVDLEALVMAVAGAVAGGP